MNTYQKIILIVLISLVIVVFGIFFLKKSDSDNDKDKNLKISINLVTKENYEETPNPNQETPNPTNNQETYNICKRIISLLGDSNIKGLNDIYKNITEMSSPLKLPIDCNKVNLNELINTIFNMVNEMTFKSIENKDKEQGYNDLISLFLIIFKKLYNNDKLTLNIVYGSNGKVETIELIDDQYIITPSNYIQNMLSGELAGETQGPTPEITKQIKKAKDKAKNIVRSEDLENLKYNNNSKMKVNDFGIILSHFIAKYGTFLR
jgi:hypothetical protein